MKPAPFLCMVLFLALSFEARAGMSVMEQDEMLDISGNHGISMAIMGRLTAGHIRINRTGYLDLQGVQITNRNTTTPGDVNIGSPGDPVVLDIGQGMAVGNYTVLHIQLPNGYADTTYVPGLYADTVWVNGWNIGNLQINRIFQQNSDIFLMPGATGLAGWITATGDIQEFIVDPPGTGARMVWSNLYLAGTGAGPETAPTRGTGVLSLSNVSEPARLDVGYSAVTGRTYFNFASSLDGNIRIRNTSIGANVYGPICADVISSGTTGVGGMLLQLNYGATFY